VKKAFGLYRTADKAELEKELAKAIEQTQALGADPETMPKVKELRQKLAHEAVDVGVLENEVYDHLFSFFRRYYSEGDFLAKRVYKPGIYAIPYEGEEVKLHWANRDQYYIKTSEYLHDYTFRLRPDDDQKPMRVHFRLADAAEGEYGNVKAAEGKDRVFILAAGDFIAEENGELSIRFEYRPATLTDWPEDAREGKTKPPAQKELIALATKRVLTAAEASLAAWITELGRPHVKADGEKADYSRLEAHLRRYTARNTFDYFIHKDLGGFLRRELDFYIKNEVMHLDDVENESAPRVEQYLSKIKVIRRIAGKIIDFLAQLEDFQKKLWLKKKFVVETLYCITLDGIPEEFYPEIAANDAQREEWVRLFAIDQCQDDLAGGVAYSAPLTKAFLLANPSLPVDTRHFDESFKGRLLSGYSNFDEILHGTLVHGENFQALSLLAKHLLGCVDLFYIDPPYNTGVDDFPYKDAYQHSSWLSLVSDRLEMSLRLLSRGGVFACSLDDNETYRFGVMVYGLSPRLTRLGEFVWRTRNTDNRVSSGLSVDHEYIHVFAPSGTSIEGRVIDRSSFKNPDNDPRGPYTTDPLTGKANAQDRPNLHYLIVNPETGDEYPPHPDFGWITDKAGPALGNRRAIR
jgi:adenine-specific DNA-methyltransferase